MWAPPKDRRTDMCDLRGADAVLAQHAHHVCSSTLFLNASPSSSYHRIVPTQHHILSARYHHHHARRAHYSLSPKLSQTSYRSSAAFSTSNGSIGNESRKPTSRRLMIRGGMYVGEGLKGLSHNLQTCWSPSLLRPLFHSHLLPPFPLTSSFSNFFWIYTSSAILT